MKPGLRAAFIAARGVEVAVVEEDAWESLVLRSDGRRGGCDVGEDSAKSSTRVLDGGWLWAGSVDDSDKSEALAGELMSAVRHRKVRQKNGDKDSKRG